MFTAVPFDDRRSSFEGFHEERAGLGFDGGNGRIARPALGGHQVPEEGMFGTMLVVSGSERPAHAVVRDHARGELGRFLEVVLGAARDVSENRLLGSVAPMSTLSRASSSALPSWIKA